MRGDGVSVLYSIHRIYKKIFIVPPFLSRICMYLRGDTFLSILSKNRCPPFYNVYMHVLEGGQAETSPQCFIAICCTWGGTLFIVFVKINCFIWSPKICAPLPRKVDPTNDAEKFFGDQKLNSLLQKANADQDYIALRDVVNRGFPPKRNMLPEKLKDFWVFKDELTNYKGLYC